MRTRALVAVGLAVAASTLGTQAQAQNRPPSPAQNPPPPREPPRADQPIVKKIPEPRITFEGGAGIVGYIGGTAGVGPAWNVRAIGSFTPRIAAELNYTGSVNQRGDGGSLVYTSFDADFRFNILRADQAPVQPFVAAGVGYVGYYGNRGDGAAMVFPIYVGVERRFSRHLVVGGRFNLRPAVFDNLGAIPGRHDELGGDTWSLIANLGGAF